jgi:LAO/AO transport system kinase
MATRGHLGGLAVAAPEAVRVLTAAGFPWVVLETVGVGQVEIDVVGQSDTTVVVVTPGWGDAVQANKAGLMEIADVFVVNKADRPGADEAVRHLDRMLDMAGAGGDASGWRPPVVPTTATTGKGVEDVWRAIGDHRAHLLAGAGLDERRRRRAAEELTRMVAAALMDRARAATEGPRAAELAAAVARGDVDPWSAAEELLRDLRDLDKSPGDLDK